MKPTRQLTDNQYLVTYEVDQTGVRLDAFLKSRYRKRSREQLKRAIDDGAITIKRNQGPHLTVGKLKPSLQLLAGDEVLVLSERKPEPEVCFDYKVLFEDDVLFVIDKPPNLPVHPAGRYFFNTLLTHLKTNGHRDPYSPKIEYYLVHRIDKETSGVLVLTKDKEACAHLTDQFKTRSTEKRYLAIVRGEPAQKEFVVNAAMKRSDTSAVSLKMMIAPESEGAQAAYTAFRTLSAHEIPLRDGGGTERFSVIECLPKTGRQHQIRLHLESVGHPIVGDKLYGMPERESVRFYERTYLSPEAEAALLLPRHALHASAIRFEHPVSGERLEFESPLPADLQAFLRQDRLSELPANGRRPGW